MIKRRIKDRKLLSEINVIPYVDISLVLLVIFMVATPFMIQGIDLDLPKTDSQALNKSKGDNLTISISEEGFFSLDIGEKDKIYRSFDKFSNHFKKIMKNNANIEVFVRADKETKYNNVAQIMSLIKNYKSDSINLITVESNISKQLEKIQKKYRKDIDIGSYPFFRLGRVGVSVVLRSQNKHKIILCKKEILNNIVKKKKIKRV